jgi:hypothetical protein
MKKASLFGPTFRNDVDIDGDILKASINNSYKEFMRDAYAKISKPERDDGPAYPEARYENLPFLTVIEIAIVLLFEDLGDLTHGQYLQAKWNIIAPGAVLGPCRNTARAVPLTPITTTF